jgi:hypothetical protein
MYPKLRTLRNVSSKVEIFTCVRAEISRAVCYSIPNNFPSLAPRTGSTVVSTLRRDISDTEQKNLITRTSMCYIRQVTNYSSSVVVNENVGVASTERPKQRNLVILT